MLKTFSVIASLLLSNVLHAHPDKAHVDVADAWIRPTVAGQMGTGGFMKLTARDEALTLTGVSAKLTQAAEVHEMRPSKADANVMEMRQVTGIALPKGQTVELKPGGYHLMLMDLKEVLKNGQAIPLTLHFKDAKGNASKLEVAVPVGRAGLQAPAGAASQPAMPAHHKH